MPVETSDIHARSLATSSALSGYYLPHFIPPLDVFRVLDESQVRFLLLGTYALGGWMREPRATTDVDILTSKRVHNKTVRTLLAAFPQLRAEGEEDETRLRDEKTGQVLIDVVKTNHLLYRQAFRHVHVVESGGRRYRIPSLELALAMKHWAMLSPARDYADRLLDAHDFLCMIQANVAIDSRTLHSLGELVYPGGGAEVVENVRKVRAGEKLTL